ncbi:MAG: membrane dipeptidase [Clostridiales bacterium]|nr:membrane dipeptidase [Clostridiales bacterium]
MIFDLHNDLVTAKMPLEQMRRFIKSNARVKMTLAVWTSKIADPLPFIAEVIRQFSPLGNVLFAVEDLWFLTEKNLAALCALPLSYCTLAWDTDNAVAGGHKGTGGVTEFGKRAVAAMNKSGIAVDAAHLNERSFYNLLDLTDTLICSHACLKETRFHSRNLSPEQVKNIIARGGVVGLTAVADFLPDGEGARGGFVNQLCAFASRYGVDSLALGTDLFGTDPLKGLETYEKFASLAYDLEGAGFTAGEAEKILFRNADKFFSD